MICRCPHVKRRHLSLPYHLQVVVFLMDTQGTFDSESTVKDNATVFALSTMISSVQIYNLSQNIEEDDLQHLQLFTDYGRLAKENSIGKPFQKLQFLIRDWNYPYEYQYGAEGGQMYLSKILQVEERQHEELRNLRMYITSTFDEIACFLMPHPGMTVATHREFNGKLTDISEEFKSELKKLVPMILAPENLVPKLIEGQKVKAKDLLHIFKAYMKVFSGNELPEPKSILEATAEANNLSACAEAQDVYKTLMEEVCGGSRPYIQPHQLEQEHTRIMNKALHAFENKKKMGGDERSSGYKKKLEAELEELYTQYRAHNEGKNLYKMFKTPSVFLMLAVVLFLFSVFADMLGIQSLRNLLQMLAMGCLGMSAVWLYAKLSGRIRETGEWLDETADTVLDLLRNQALGPHANQMHVPPAGPATSQDKKSS
ncbi:hypothetical protein O3G_MSEX002086 [Manduca sexta]|uniref:GB1/RHD3-type G domain-containing protein n=1 Tax=Manduca sexta TaxID=7130 RepID=A0A921YMM1_MANSE|nr:hypothetical protein O3G_MSEX002086 [Manduca sexta]